jgi:hypothetical protein
MNDNSFTTTLNLSQNPETVFNHINDVSKWWTKDAEEIASKHPTEFEGRSAKLNDEFILRHGTNHYSRQKLIEVIPNKKVVWQVTDSKLHWIKGNKEEWTGTTIIFDLSPQGGKTVLTFTHQGLTPQLECYEHCIHFWNMVIKEWLIKSITSNKTV